LYSTNSDLKILKKITDLFNQFIFDLDGVVYVGNKITPSADDVIRAIRNKGKRVSFITNNPTRSRTEYRRKLNDLNIDAVEEDITTSCNAVHHYLAKKYRDIKYRSVYVIGSDYLKTEVARTGAKIAREVKSHTADIVVAGGHNKFNYDELKNASLAIQNGAFFLVTNKDSSYPSIEGLLPGTGAIVSSIEKASGKTARVAGKPEKYIFDICIRTDKGKTVIIGDNLYTDIKGGKNAGIKTVLTLTGFTKQKDTESNKIKPDYIINDLSGLLK